MLKDSSIILFLIKATAANLKTIKGIEIWGNFIFKFDRHGNLTSKYLDD